MDEHARETHVSPSQAHAPFSTNSPSATTTRPASRMLDKPFQSHKRKTSNTPQKKDELVLGQLSYAPATQTTVVTTTTTTTTTFPPFLMKAPKHLDSKNYPLASSPTPALIKRLQFNIGNHSAVFQEAEDTDATLKDLEREQKHLHASGGKIQRVSALSEFPLTPSSHMPISRTRLDGNRPRARAPLQRSTSRGILTSNPRSSRLQTTQTSSPFTPSSIDTQPLLQDSFLDSRDVQSSAIITPEMEDAEFSQILSPRPEDEVEKPNQSSSGSNFFAVTPSTREVMNRRVSSSRARPSTLDMSSTQDASLPSPSLSPVTAAANLQNKRDFFNDSHSNSNMLLQESTHLEGSYNDSSQGSSIFGRQPSIHDMPTMLDAFDCMPDEMKNYYMYQVLRRCPKGVLHFVADTVNPALKRDFIGELPPELAQAILMNLDMRTLCRASQVSKQWRKIIDTDEKIWRDLFDAAGYNLSDLELKSAINQGWGWQSDSRLDGQEENLGATHWESHNSPLRTSGTVTPDRELVQEPVSLRRNKRKAHASKAPGRKLRRRRGTATSDQIAEFDDNSFTKHVASIDGPYAAAEAALATIPTADVGIPSLNVLHLHKSLYRRHHLFSKSWMQNQTEPRHLAFKAHNLNVVTCLQFDSERIITGSDDTSINVYDTQTGALKSRLEGHDGGVWALQYIGNQLVSGSTDRSVRIWDMDNGVCSHTFLGHTSTVRCLIILTPTLIGRTASGAPITMPREPLIITGSRDSTLRVWKLPKPTDPPFQPNTNAPDDQDCPYLVRTLAGHGHSVRAIAAHGDTLVSGSYDYTVRVWKISTGETVWRLVGHGQKVYSVVLDHERNRCISGSMDNMVKVWSLETGNMLFNLEGHTSLVGLLDLQRGRLVSAAADSNLRIWDLDSGVCVKNLVGHNGAITCFQHDGVKIVSGSDRNLKMWDVQTGEFIRDLLYDLSGVWQVKFDERRCVAAVQRNGQTYIEVIDFGASRDGVPAAKRGRRILVDLQGIEIHEPRETAEEADDDDDDDQ